MTMETQILLLAALMLLGMTLILAVGLAARRWEPRPKLLRREDHRERIRLAAERRRHQRKRASAS